jgi:hypothetical protein
VNHICRARHAFQVTAATLFALAKTAHKIEDPDTPFKQWIAAKQEGQPQAGYWWHILQLELLILEVGCLEFIPIWL